MKKAPVITAVLISLSIFAVFILAIFISFKTVRPTTESINHDLENYFAKIIYIPSHIPRPMQDFDFTEYFWEMETPQGEVTGIKVRYNPAFTKDQNIIQVTLEMPQGGDPSIFNKVMPAVIADKQSLDSARDPLKANLGSNESAGYEKITLFVKNETNQTTKIVWEFKKQSLGEEINKKYARLATYPIGLLKWLYGLPHLVLSLLAAG